MELEKISELMPAMSDLTRQEHLRLLTWVCRIIICNISITTTAIFSSEKQDCRDLHITHGPLAGPNKVATSQEPVVVHCCKSKSSTEPAGELQAKLTRNGAFDSCLCFVD